MRFNVFLVLLCIYKCSCGKYEQSRMEWIRPGERVPKIQAFFPKGLRVTIDSQRGPSTIRFVGTLLRDSKNIPIEGTFFLDERRPKRRRWVFEDLEAVLKVGDVISYEIFMEAKGGSSFKTYDGNDQIYALLDYNTCRKHNMRHCGTSNMPPPITEEPAKKGAATPPTTESTAALDLANFHIVENKLKYCQQSIINTTNVLLELQSQILRLETKNELLTNILSKWPNAKEITISGVIPQDGTAAEAVEFIIWEKLDIKPDIVSARRENATTIVFEVETIEQKLNILEEAEDRLVTGRIVVF